MQIERAISGVTTLGPGNRLVVWVNGCHRHCRGCVSPRLQKDAPQNECDVIDYLQNFDWQSIDGLTVSGGEPFDQAAELLTLVKYSLSNNVDDILVYTGYTLEELISKNNSDINKILDSIAVIIDGPYIQELNENVGNLAGSSNQRIIVLKKKFAARYEDYKRDERSVQEFHLGSYFVAVGIPTREYVLQFLSDKE